MDIKNIDFIRKYYGDARIRKLLFAQSENYTYCIGTGKTLVERGWTLPIKVVPVEKLDELLNDGLDIFFPIRTKDDEYLYILWDIEYFNTADKPYIFNRENQKRIFEWMSPALTMVEEILNSYGIKHLVDITMSGIHVWTKISTKSEAYKKLASEGCVLPSLAEKYSEIIPSDRKRTRAVPAEMGLAYNAAGKVLEFFTHDLIVKNSQANPYKIPVTISDAPQLGEHFPFSGISSDLTQYAHPIYMRCIRAFCSLHQKSLLNGFEHLSSAIDILKTNQISYMDAVDMMWDVDKTINFYHENFSDKLINVPDASEGWLKAVNSYLKSDTRKYHKEWEESPEAPDLPEHSRDVLAQYLNNSTANPGLLTPFNLQSLVEYFGDNGASVTKKIFSTIASNYYLNDSLGWYDPQRFTGIDWRKYDAHTAADFWGRVYWTLKKVGLGRKNK